MTQRHAEQVFEGEDILSSLNALTDDVSRLVLALYRVQDRITALATAATASTQTCTSSPTDTSPPVMHPVKTVDAAPVDSANAAPTNSANALTAHSADVSSAKPLAPSTPQEVANILARQSDLEEGGKWYIVTQGRCPGVYPNMLEAGPQVHGISFNSYLGVKGKAKALAEYTKAYANGNVHIRQA